MPEPSSERLRYARLRPEDAETLLRLAQDEHIRRWLLDGEVVDEGWAIAACEASEACFEASGAGLYLVHRDGAPIGFCGFHVFEELGPEAQLLYALLESHTGVGLASEITGALLTHVQALGWSEVVSAVDAPNAASSRVLEKAGFVRTGETPGAFGPTLLYRWTPA